MRWTTVARHLKSRPRSRLPLRQVSTLERWSRQASVVGWAVLPVFLDPKTQQQPVSAYVADYVLNQVREGVRGRTCHRYAHGWNGWWGRSRSSSNSALARADHVTKQVAWFGADGAQEGC